MASIKKSVQDTQVAPPSAEARTEPATADQICRPWHARTGMGVRQRVVSKGKQPPSNVSVQAEVAGFTDDLIANLVPFTNRDVFYSWVAGSDVPVEFYALHKNLIEISKGYLTQARDDEADPPIQQIILGCPPRLGLSRYPARYVQEIHSALRELIIFIQENDPSGFLMARDLKPVASVYYELSFHLTQGSEHLQALGAGLGEVLRANALDLADTLARMGADTPNSDYVVTFINHAIAEICAFVALMRYYEGLERLEYFTDDLFRWDKVTNACKRSLVSFGLTAIAAIEQYSKAHTFLVGHSGFLNEVLKAREGKSTFWKAKSIQLNEDAFVSRMIEYSASRIIMSMPCLGDNDRKDVYDLVDTFRLFDERSKTFTVVEALRQGAYRIFMRRPPVPTPVSQGQAAETQQGEPGPIRRTPSGVAAYPQPKEQSLGFGEQSSDEDSLAEADQHAAVMCPSVVVIREKFALRDKITDQSVIKAHEMAAQPIRLFDLDNAAEPNRVIEILENEFPYMQDIPREMLSRTRVGKGFSLRPFLLVGEPGIGKSYFARRICQVLGIPFRLISMPATADSSFAGTSKQWNSARMSVPLQAVVQFEVANPLLILDEIDKISTGDVNGSPVASILPLLDRATSSYIQDICLETAVDLSRVCYIATANKTKAMHPALLDRFEILHIPAPRKEDLPFLATNLAMAMKDDHPDAVYGLDENEIKSLSAHWDGGSMRRLSRMVNAVLRARENFSILH